MLRYASGSTESSSRSRQRGVSTPVAVLLAAAAGLGAAALMSSWVVVDVLTPAPESLHFTVPLPLAAARAAVAFVPNDVLNEARVPAELTAHREGILTALRSLDGADDATLVAVDSPDATVRIDKRGHELLIAVDADDARVRCTVPLDGVIDALETWDWETADPAVLLRALASARHGELATVEADGARVAVRVW